jgi:AcrR family transcriptional regulator
MDAIARRSEPAGQEAPAVRDHRGTKVSRRAPGAAVASDAELLGLRERKKARLRKEIIKTAIRLFRKKGYQNTRIDDIVQVLEISQPTFFRYFPSKDAVLREVGMRGYACIGGHLRSELSSQATTADRVRHLYRSFAEELEADRPLWEAVVLSGAMDPVHSPEMRKHKEAAIRMLRDVLAAGQKKGEITPAFPVAHLAEFMDGMYTTMVRHWAVSVTGPHSLADRLHNAVEFFLRGVRP